MRTIKENGITKHFVFVGENEELELSKVYSELLIIVNKYIRDPKDNERAKDLMAAIYMPSFMAMDKQ